MSREKSLTSLSRPGRRAAMMCLCGLAVSGCGFEPLYAERAVSGSAPILSQVGIEKPETDGDGIVYSALFRIFRPAGPAAYRLVFRSDSRQRGMLLETDSRSARERLNLTIDYQLFDSSTGAEITRGSATGTASYNLDESEYANMIARENATSKAAKQAGEKIGLQLGRWHRTRDARAQNKDRRK